MKTTLFSLLITVLLGASLFQSACHWGESSSPQTGITEEVAQPTAPVATPHPAAETATPDATGQPHASSVMVNIKMVVQKEFGLLARLAGKRDITETSLPYDVDNAWWDNPLVVYADAPLSDADVRARSDSDPIFGRGVSANVTVQATLVPQAVVAWKTDPKSDGIKGTITVSIDALAQYYDGVWTPMVQVADKTVTFEIDTCDPRRRIEPVFREVRTIESFDYEGYTREHQRWGARASWPVKAASGDWRAVITGKDVRLDVTGYRYVAAEATAATSVLAP